MSYVADGTVLEMQIETPRLWEVDPFLSIVFIRENEARELYETLKKVFDNPVIPGQYQVVGLSGDGWVDGKPTVG